MCVHHWGMQTGFLEVGSAHFINSSSFLLLYDLLQYRESEDSHGDRDGDSERNKQQRRSKNKDRDRNRERQIERGNDCDIEKRKQRQRQTETQREAKTERQAQAPTEKDKETKLATFLTLLLNLLSPSTKLVCACTEKKETKDKHMFKNITTMQHITAEKQRSVSLNIQLINKDERNADLQVHILCRLSIYIVYICTYAYMRFSLSMHTYIVGI